MANHEAVEWTKNSELSLKTVHHSYLNFTNPVGIDYKVFVHIHKFDGGYPLIWYVPNIEKTDHKDRNSRVAGFSICLSILNTHHVAYIKYQLVSKWIYNFSNESTR